MRFFLLVVLHLTIQKVTVVYGFSSVGTKKHKSLAKLQDQRNGNDCENFQKTKSLEYNKEDDIHLGQKSKKRRNLIHQSLLMSSALPFFSLLSSLNINANAESKVALSTSSANVPAKYPGTSTVSTSNILDPTEEDMLTATELRRIAVFEKVAPSVVYIDTFAEQRDAFSTNILEVPLGAGSGFVWDEAGHIVTNYHVIRTAKVAQVAILTRIFDDEEEDNENSLRKKTKKLSKSTKDDKVIPFTSSSSSSSSIYRPNMPDTSITNYTRSVYKARVVGVDPSKDIAVLKVDAPVYDLHPISLASSSNVKVGQTAMAIGNPFGLDHTLTSGIVSGLGREVKSPIGRPISNAIQTDAAVNPGNSGGPLLNSSGKMIGMATAIYSPSGASAGIGFAIPSDTIKYIVDILIRDGKIVRPKIGISFLDSKQAYALGINRGILILDVPMNTPAYKAGLKGTRRTSEGLLELGDIIVKINDDDVNKESDLFAALEKYKPGDKVKITVKRVDSSSGTMKIKEVVLFVQLASTSSEMVNVSLDGGRSTMKLPKDMILDE